MSSIKESVKAPSFAPMTLILGSIVGLAVMGLVFCWAYADMLNIIGSPASRYYFNRQAIWNSLGLVAFVMATIVGWKRWLKSAPFVFAGWVILWFAAHMREFVTGSSTIVLIGPVSLEVWSLFTVAIALLVAWLRDRYGVQTKRILLIVGIAVFATIAGRVASDADRLTRLVSVLSGDGAPVVTPSACASSFVQSQTRAAFVQAQWFSSTDEEILRETPGNATYSMPASSAVLFGKWFMAVAWVFFALIALGFACLWRKTEDKAKRAYFLVSGLGIIVPAVLGHCECLGLIPMLYTSVPLVSNDTTAILVSWLGGGILVSSVVNADEYGLVVWSRADYTANAEKWYNVGHETEA